MAYDLHADNFQGVSCEDVTMLDSHGAVNKFSFVRVSPIVVLSACCVRYALFCVLRM